MKVNLKSDHNTIKSEGLKSHQYSIKEENMGFLLELLRKDFYSNPIGSICREISANARDAHREARTAMRPITISIQDSIWTEGEICINIEDRGVGISPQRITEVLVNYGESTKRGSNKENGAFGLGAKTPYAYSDTYMVITRYDGIEYSYFCSAEKNERGSMDLAEEKPTKEGNGTQVIIPIKHEDRERFEKECYIATGFWTVRPNYVNFKTKFNFKKLHTHEDIDIVSNEWVDENGHARTLVSGYNILIDKIIYPVDNRQIEEIEINTSATVLLKFKNGELELVPNREQIQYTKATTELLNEKVKNFKDSFRQKLNDHLNKCSTYAKACLEAYKIANAYGEDTVIPYVKEILNFSSKENFFYNEEKINWSLTQFKHFSFHFHQEECNPNNLSNIGEAFSEYPIVFMDTSRMAKARDKTMFDEYGGYVMVRMSDDLKNFSGFSFGKQKRFAREMRKTLNEWARMKEIGFDIINYTDIEKSKLAKKIDLNKYKTIKARAFVGSDRRDSDINSKDKPIELYVHPHIIESNVTNLADDSELVDNKSFVIHPVESMKDIETYRDSWRGGRRYRNGVAPDFMFKVERVWEMGYAVLVICERFIKNFKDFKTVDDIMEFGSIEKRINELAIENAEAGALSDFNSDDEVKTLGKFAFNSDDINNTLAECKRLIDTDCDRVYIPEKYREEHTYKKQYLLDKTERMVKALYRKYPLLNHADEYKNKKDSEFQDYIDMVDSRVEVKRLQRKISGKVDGKKITPIVQLPQTVHTTQKV